MKSLLYCLPIAVAALAPSLSQADVSFYVNVAPPVLPVYVQPPIPAYGYIWTPGYWSWNDDYGDYYWVPGAWVTAPYVGALWTPGYWAASGDRFAWHNGYWGTRIGFYGGVNYGYGYAGVGYQGGYWDRGEFRYNRAVNNITTRNITNVYNARVVNNFNNNHVSYNGGFGGIRLRPTVAEQNAGRMPYNVAPTAMQVQHPRPAIGNPMPLAPFNHGLPQVAATPAPGAFSAVRGQSAQPARTPDRYAQTTALPMQREVMRAQPMQNLQQSVRPPAQAYPYQQAISRAAPMQPHANALHPEHAVESKFRER